MEFLTFLLAFAGYAGLTAASLLAARGGRRLPRSLVYLTAAIVVTHVSMVWAVRYEWRVAMATRNGLAGFVVFHTALAMIAAAVVAPERAARRLLWISFLVVSLGALGAVFRYDVVAIYRVPVILLAVGGAAGLVRAWWRHR